MKQQTTKSGSSVSRLLYADPVAAGAATTTPSSGAAPAALDLGNAVLEGGYVQLGMTELYNLIDAALIPRGSALVALEFPRTNPNVDIVKTVYEVELREGGVVHEIDLEKRGRELNLIEPFQSVSKIWG